MSTEDIVENTTQLKFSHDVNPKIDALCDTAVDTAEELKKDDALSRNCSQLRRRY